MKPAKTSAERQKEHLDYKRKLGVCIHGGCWKKQAPGRVRCPSHLTANKNGDGQRKPAAPASQPVKEATNAASLPRPGKNHAAH